VESLEMNVSDNGGGIFVNAGIDGDVIGRDEDE
jgi:hypothetical protein